VNKEMKILITLIIAVSLLCGITQPAFAQTGSIKIEDLLTNPSLTAEERNKLAKVIREKTDSQMTLGGVVSTLGNSTKWQEIGIAFSETIKQVCQTLNVEVNQFIKSDVGKLTAGIIIYRMVGKDLLRILIISLFMLGLTFFIFSSIYFVHGKKKWKIKDKEGNEHIESEDRWINWGDGDGNNARLVSVCIHLIAWFVAMCISTVQMVS
jgi:hypothetical protein